ncbi:MAG: HEAT repeat domain-containing protein, partial [Pirellula sp.]|nr:HEAT repeat domain-containing protein [Pirellula sp.]
MEIDPLETSDEARLWGLRILQKLESNSRGEGLARSEFPEPEFPFWSIAVAKELAENWENYAADLTNAAREGAGIGGEGPSAVGETAENAAGFQPSYGALEKLLQKISQWLRQSVAAPLESEEGALRRLLAVQTAAELYLKIRHGRFTRIEGALLQVPFASGHSTAIRMGVDLLLQQPPDAWTSASLALSPLLQYDDWDRSIVFPRVFDTANPSILSSALDIANHLYTHRKIDAHPAKERYPLFVKLLGEIVQRLGILEENPAKFGDSAESIQRILFDSVSLCVSLCHTMSAIGDPACIGKLNQALDLKHRRIRTEAAFALGRLGEQHGIDALVEMAIDPAVRTRVIAYAEELGC